MLNQTIRFIKFYQRSISPLSCPKCRFLPTCSQYAIDAFRYHNTFKATFLVLKRLMSVILAPVDEAPNQSIIMNNLTRFLLYGVLAFVTVNLYTNWVNRDLKAMLMFQRLISSEFSYKTPANLSNRFVKIETLSLWLPSIS